MKFQIAFVICFVLFGYSQQLTVDQMRKTALAMRNVCQPKNRVTLDQIQNINKGEFLEDRNVKCYVACILKMAQTIKNGKINYNSAVRQIDILFPEELKASAKKSLDSCKDVPNNYTDICEASFETAKCMYNTDPDNFVFP